MLRRRDAMSNKKNFGRPLKNLPSDYTIVDLETTGFSPTTDHIIEVGCIKYRAHKEVARYQTFVKPPIRVRYFITELTGITNDMLRDAPAFSAIADDLWDFLKEEVIVGHNITFDLDFLYANFLSTIKKHFKNYYVDSLALSRKHFTTFKHHNLETLCAQLNIKTKQHRALSDCLIVAELLERMGMKTVEKESVPMPINIQRGQKIDLTKSNPTLKQLLIGVGWKKEPGFELDSAAFLLDSTGKATCEDDFIFYNNVKHNSGAIIHLGNRNEDNEQMQIDLWRVPPAIHKIDFTLTIYDAEQRKQNFSQLAEAYIRIIDVDTNKEIVRYNLGSDFSIETAIVVGEIYRHGSDWKFHALGSGFGGGLAALVRNFGLTIGSPVEKKEQISVSVLPSVKADVKKLAALRQCTMSDIVSEALGIYLDAHRADIQRYDQLKM